MCALHTYVFRLLFTREEAAEVLSISTRKLDELLARKIIATRRIDGLVRIHIDELRRFALNEEGNDAGSALKQRNGSKSDTSENTGAVSYNNSGGQPL